MFKIVSNSLTPLFIITLLAVFLAACSSKDKAEPQSNLKPFNEGYYLFGDNMALRVKKINEESSEKSEWSNFEIYEAKEIIMGHLGTVPIATNTHLIQLYTVDQESIAHGVIQVLDNGTVELHPLKINDLGENLKNIGFEADGNMNKIAGLRNRDLILSEMKKKISIPLSTPKDEVLKFARIDQITTNAIWEETAQKAVKKAQASKAALNREVSHITVGSTMTVDYGRGVIGLNDVYVMNIRNQSPRVNVRYEDGEYRWVKAKYIITKSSADKQRNKAAGAVLKGFLQLMSE